MSAAVITFFFLSNLPITVTPVPTASWLFRNARLKIDTPTTPDCVTSLKFILFSPALKRISIGTLSTFPSITIFSPSSTSCRSFLFKIS